MIISKIWEDYIIDKQSIKINIWQAILYCIIWMLVPMVVVVAIVLGIMSINSSFDVISFLDNSFFEMFLSYLGLYLTIVLITRNNIKKLNLSFKGSINKYWVIGTVLFSAGLHIIISELSNVLQYYKPVSGHWLEAFEKLSAMSPIVFFLVVVVTAPIVEELFLRGVIVRGLANKYSNRKAIIYTALLFGLVHLNIWQFSAAFIAGLFLSWLYLKSNALLLSILAHAIHNGLGLFVGAIGIQIVGYNIENPGIMVQQPLWFNSLGIVLMIAAVFLFKKAIYNNKFSSVISS